MMKDLKRSSSDSKDTKKLRKILHEEIRLGIKGDSDSEEEEKVNLRKEIYPLGHYINDREEMIEEMFSLVKGEKLGKMLPSIIKDMPLDELKADCLIHLLGMSKKRIYAVLEGRQIDSSSDSESHSDGSNKPKKKELPIVNPIVIKQEGCSDISDNSEEVVLIDPDSCESVISQSKKKSKKGAKRTKHSEKHEKSKKAKKKIPTVEAEVERPVKQHKNNEASDSENDNGEAAVPTGGKNLLEILELEMRARAIRALLHKDGPKGDDKSKKLIGETNHSDSDGSAEDSGKTEDNKVTPARNIRKRKITNDDVIVVTPKLVTIDLTDELDSRLKNKTPQNTVNDSVVAENEYDVSIVTENDPTPVMPSDTRQEPENCALIDKQDESENSIFNCTENKSRSIVLNDNKEPEAKTLGDSTPKTGLSSKECELEDGELDGKEEKGDHDLLTIQPEDSEQGRKDNKDIAPNIEIVSVKQTELDIGESSVNNGELIEIGETVILSDDDSILSESNLLVNKDRTEQNNGKIDENPEVCKSINSGEQITVQSGGESGDITKDTNAKKNWAQRWLESKEVKKVVSTSKLCGSIRKRIKIAKMAKKKSLEENHNDNKQNVELPPPQDIQGSVDEYQLLPKSMIVYNTDKHDGADEECKVVQNEVSGPDVPTIDSTPENATSNEQVQDVTSTENMENENILDQFSDSKLNVDNNQALTQPHPVVIETNNCDQEQNETESITKSIDQISVLKTCDSSNTTVAQTDIDENGAVINNDDKLGSSNQQIEVNATVDTNSGVTRAKSLEPSSSEPCVNEKPQNDTPVKLVISENVSNGLNDSNDKLQSPLIVTSDTNTTNDKETDETLGQDQNGPETLEINITDEELEIDGIINDIINPSNEDVVWSKSEIVEID